MSYQGKETVATDQNTDKPDFTSTTLLRLILDYADDVDEAVEIASSYDLHDSAKTSYHYMVADASGRSVILEWVAATDSTDNDGSVRELVVTYNDDGNGCTVHSVIYNLTDKTALWIPNEHYGDEAAIFSFSLGD